MPLGTSDLTPRKATAAEEAGIVATAKAEAKAADKPGTGQTRIYPTHRTAAGPLLVSLPSDGVNSPDPLEITDEGADVDDEIAAHLIHSGDAMKTAPQATDADVDGLEDE